MNYRYRHPKHDNDHAYFAHPSLFDLPAPVSGQELFKRVRVFFRAFGKPVSGNMPPFPSIELSVRVEQRDIPIADDDAEIPLTNEEKNTCTVHVDLSYHDVCHYVDMEKAVAYQVIDEFKKSHINVYDCLKLFTAPEVLETPWKCKACDKNREASKQLHLWRLPEILIIHLKRFVGGVMGFLGGYGRKIQGLVDFPIRDLDLTPYLPEEQKSQSVVPKYDLFAVIVMCVCAKKNLLIFVAFNHFGIMEGGHYWAYVRTDRFAQCPNIGQFKQDDVQNEEWYRFDDQKLMPLKREDVVSANAYVLFYRRRQQPIEYIYKIHKTLAIYNLNISFVGLLFNKERNKVFAGFEMSNINDFIIQLI
ncbi:hypothetical protein RFI_21048 [Reticulomyxa filosa]|uniref:ubiquitinyl hydrolase 1 n=1 Tax=Reticulomyxa filosa TaxID=46433 RepID=X6MRM1_RETFI|nr:hypothetical protein RFI_21048 [Reticulomyxa filosa]|eukprot:ETO16306.1 hypothetical protein RFI_21048 [Reticulomyxa filosa]